MIKSRLRLLQSSDHQYFVNLHFASLIQEVIDHFNQKETCVIEKQKKVVERMI